MKFGDYLSNASMPINEVYFQQSPNATLGANENFIYAGTYQMPWTGHLVVDMWAEVNWPGTSTLSDGAAVWLSVNSPNAFGVEVGSSSADLGLYMDCAGIFSYAGECRTHAMWYNLSAGTNIQIRARIWTNVLGQVRVVHVGGFFRPAAI